MNNPRKPYFSSKQENSSNVSEGSSASKYTRFLNKPAAHGGEQYSAAKAKSDYLDINVSQDKRTNIGPSQHWNRAQQNETGYIMKTHYEAMNNKENFGGDMDDIEEMSEMIDDGSKFVYTSEEEEQEPQEVYQEEDIQHYSSAKKNFPSRFDKAPHQQIDLFSSDGDDNQVDDNFHYEDDDEEQQEPNEDFKVVDVVDAARKIEEDIQRLLKVSQSPAKSSQKESQSKTSSVQDPPSPPHTELQAPMTNPNPAPVAEQKYAKYKIPRATAKLDSVTFSDIVNYESNDDLVSLTGDRRLVKGYHQLAPKAPVATSIVPVDASSAPTGPPAPIPKPQATATNITPVRIQSEEQKQGHIK